MKKESTKDLEEEKVRFDDAKAAYEKCREEQRTIIRDYLKNKAGFRVVSGGGQGKAFLYRYCYTCCVLYR